MKCVIEELRFVLWVMDGSFIHVGTTTVLFGF